MRIDLESYAFTNAANGAILADLDLSGFEYAAIGVFVSSWTGVPATRTYFYAVPVDDVPNEYLAGDFIQTIDITAATTGGFMLSRIGIASAAATAFLGEAFLLPPPLKRVRVKVAMTTATAVTGVVKVWKYTR